MRYTSFKDYSKRQLEPLCVRLVLIMLLYTVFRIVFYLANAGDFPSAGLSLFLHGMRFDLSAVFYTNAPYIIAVLLPFSFVYKKTYQRICNAYFIVINSFAALVSYIDVAYYPYVLKRLTADIFSYVQVGFDFQTLLPSFFKQFWYLVLLFLATIFFIVFIVKITCRIMRNNIVCQKFTWKNLLYKIMVFCGFIAISVICMRGGLQLRPITLIHTAQVASIQNAALVANTPFTIIHTFGKKYDIEKHYFNSLEEAERYYNPVIQQITTCSESGYPVKNVVVIVMESFSQYLLRGLENNANTDSYQGYCPFLDSLMKRSVSFNGIANGKRTIEALPAIFGGIPTLLDMSYVESSFANNYSYSPVEILKNNGYNTVFFHGGKNGTVNLESYCYSIGFEKHYGKNEYPNQSDYDGVWGISDRPYLQYVAKQLNAIPHPFFAGILTLSSHNRFVLPKDAEGLDIKHGTHPMHAVSSYTDHAIREFLEAMSQYSWYDSTLFVFTGDHTGEATVPIANNRYMAYQIPIFFYHPLANTSQTKGIIQQVDIMPTIFSCLKINTPLFSYGRNVFDTTNIPCAINYLSGIYQLFTDDFILQFDGQKTVGFYDIKSDILLQHNLMDNPPAEQALYEQKLKAVIQSYTTRMARNMLYIKNTK
jgi:phosphoglycerol transferase MdoB-like AlkP superfamily enzyme